MSIDNDILKLKEIERELRVRREVYPRWIAQGKITDGLAMSRIAVLESIAQDYRAKIEAVQFDTRERR